MAQKLTVKFKGQDRDDPNVVVHRNRAIPADTFEVSPEGLTFKDESGKNIGFYNLEHVISVEPRINTRGGADDDSDDEG